MLDNWDILIIFNITYLDRKGYLFQGTRLLQ